MLEIADIFRQAGAAYRKAFGSRMLPSHLKVMREVEDCRTPALGGHLRECDHCDAPHYSYHSCKNRHCPKCQGDQTSRWLDKQRSRLLHCPYFLATFTLPSGLRPFARSHQKLLYGALMKAAAESLLKLTNDPRYLGARPGLLAVLHTWTRDMRYHPHVHILVTAGGWRDEKNPAWVRSKRPEFLLPGRALSLIFRAKLRDALLKAGLLDETPSQLWFKDWVVHLEHAGSGERALEYLARYVFRIAIVNSRLERFENGEVTFRYKDNRTQTTMHRTLAVSLFIARFLQHVLPKGFSKVRSYGLFSPTQKDQLDRARAVLLVAASAQIQDLSRNRDAPTTSSVAVAKGDPRCPVCKIGFLRVVMAIPRWRPPP